MNLHSVMSKYFRSKLSHKIIIFFRIEACIVLWIIKLKKDLALLIIVKCFLESHPTLTLRHIWDVQFQNTYYCSGYFLNFVSNSRILCKELELTENLPDAKVETLLSFVMPQIKSHPSCVCLLNTIFLKLWISKSCKHFHKNVTFFTPEKRKNWCKLTFRLPIMKLHVTIKAFIRT